jgi:hypothetical protein
MASVLHRASAVSHDIFKKTSRLGEPAEGERRMIRVYWWFVEPKALGGRIGGSQSGSGQQYHQGVIES